MIINWNNSNTKIRIFYFKINNKCAMPSKMPHRSQEMQNLLDGDEDEEKEMKRQKIQVLYDEFIARCKRGDIARVKELYGIINLDRCIDLSDGVLFKMICFKGYLNLAKWMLCADPRIDVTMNNNVIFYTSCSNGHIHLTSWLRNIIPEVELDICLKNALRLESMQGNIKVVKWLYETVPNIDMDRFAFYFACIRGRLNVARWLFFRNAGFGSNDTAQLQAK